MTIAITCATTTIVNEAKGLRRAKGHDGSKLSDHAKQRWRDPSVANTTTTAITGPTTTNVNGANGI